MCSLYIECTENVICPYIYILYIHTLDRERVPARACARACALLGLDVALRV